MLVGVLLITGCTHTVRVSVRLPFDEIMKPTDELCVGEEDIGQKGKVGTIVLDLIVYDKNDNQIDFKEEDLTDEQEEALASLKGSRDVSVGDLRFHVDQFGLKTPPEDKIILVGTSNESPPCEKRAKDDRTFPALINETGLEIYPGDKQTGPNDFIDEPATAVLIIKIQDSEETAYQAIKDQLKDIGATDIKRVDGSKGDGYSTKIEATVEDKKVDILVVSNETGTFVIYTIFKEE